LVACPADVETRVAEKRRPVSESRTLGLRSHPQFELPHEDDEQLEQLEQEDERRSWHDEPVQTASGGGGVAALPCAVPSTCAPPPS
jgi:hypothetical protein